MAQVIFKSQRGTLLNLAYNIPSISHFHTFNVNVTRFLLVMAYNCDTLKMSEAALKVVIQVTYAD